MRLKWLPVRLRRRRRVSRVAVDPAPERRPSTSLHFCGGAGQRQLLPAHKGAVGRWLRALAWRTYSPAPVRRSGVATEESLRVLSHVAAQASRGWAPLRRRESEAFHCVQWALTALSPAGRSVAPCVAVVGARMAASDPS